MVLPRPVRVSISCNWLAGTVSPTQAMASGINAAAPNAISTRANSSMSRLCENTATRLATQPNSAA